MDRTNHKQIDDKGDYLRAPGKKRIGQSKSLTDLSKQQASKQESCRNSNSEIEESDCEGFSRPSSKCICQLTGYDQIQHQHQKVRG